MRIQVLDLDGSLPFQTALMQRCQPVMRDLQSWGPAIRMACSFGRFRRFERALAEQTDSGPVVTCYGSGDFHHVTLALVRRLTAPFNLLVLDKHPDWMRRIPFLHCGTWLYHAARLPMLQQVFHAGGELDFDNSYRWLAPWPLLRTGRITVLPAVRRFQRGAWTAIPHEPLRPQPQTLLTPDRIRELIQPFREQLARWPLYVSVDKDVLTESDAIVNWDSGHLRLEEAQCLLSAFGEAAQGRLAGLDLLGDWSPVQVQGLLRRFLHLTEHPRLEVDAVVAARRNEQTNLALLDAVRQCGSGASREPSA